MGRSSHFSRDTTGTRLPLSTSDSPIRRAEGVLDPSSGAGRFRVRQRRVDASLPVRCVGPLLPNGRPEVPPGRPNGASAIIVVDSVQTRPSRLVSRGLEGTAPGPRSAKVTVSQGSVSRHPIRRTQVRGGRRETFGHSGPFYEVVGTWNRGTHYVTRHGGASHVTPNLFH